MTVYTRQFETGLEIRDLVGDGDGRTVFGRIVPYGETIEFVDFYDGGQVKRERFVPGAFSRQSSPGAWSRVALSFAHNDGFENTIGYGRAIEDREDGAYAAFRLYESDANKAREMMEHAAYKGLSLEFETRGREEVDSDGVVLRNRVHVRRVGITNDPAFKGAKVLAVRERDDRGDEDEELRKPTPNLDHARAAIAELRRRSL